MAPRREERGRWADPGLPTVRFLANTSIANHGSAEAPESDVNFEGIVDSVRIMSRALTPDEFLHYPLPEWALQ